MNRVSLALRLCASFACLAPLALAACSGASNPLGGLGNGSGNGNGSGSGSTASDCPPFTPCTTDTGSSGGGNDAGSGSGSGSGGGSGSSSGAGGTQTCSLASACGTAGRSYQTCTTVGAAGVCSSIEYKTADGQDFACVGCSNCTTAAANLQSYCAGETTGSVSCTAPVACGETGTTYELCTTTNAGACTEMQYKLSNGTVYTCASCGDCSEALSSLDSYCNQSTTPTTSCTSWATCGTSSLSYERCTTSANGACESVYYVTSDGQMYDCNSCGDCSSALSSMDSYCASMSTSTSCGTYVTCGTGGVEYEFCTTSAGGSCESEYYSTTDGETFSCSGCDCSTAVADLDNYCASLSGTACGSTTCPTGDLCCDCAGSDECLSSNSGVDTCASYGCQ